MGVIFRPKCEAGLRQGKRIARLHVLGGIVSVPLFDDIGYAERPCAGEGRLAREDGDSRRAGGAVGGAGFPVRQGVIQEHLSAAVRRALLILNQHRGANLKQPALLPFGQCDVLNVQGCAGETLDRKSVV